MLRDFDAVQIRETKEEKTIQRFEKLEVICEQKIIKHNGQIVGKKPPLIPISMIGIERIEDIEKKIFCTKTFF